jgi:hypothetical protein
VAPVQTHHRDDLLIGEVIDISGSASRILIDAVAVGHLSTSTDAAVAMAGQVGAQVKIRVGNTWLLASIRDQQLHERGEGLIVATIDFLGEGDEEKITGRIHNFRRGVTRYPIPGSHAMRRRATTSSRYMPPTSARTSRSGPSIRPRISAVRSMSTRCWASISRCSGRPVRVNRPAPH